MPPSSTRGGRKLARYVMANRRAGKFHETAKKESRRNVDSAVTMLAGGLSVIHDNQPDDDEARRVVVFDADATEMSARSGDLPEDVLLEPEILHWNEKDVPMEFLGVSPSAHLAGSGITLEVIVTGNGLPLNHAEVSLFLRGFGGSSTRRDDVTDANGKVTFSYSPFWQPAALIATPAGDFWGTILRGPPTGSVTIDCPPLPQTGPVGWWHQTGGVNVHDETRGQGITVGVIDSGSGPHPALNHVDSVGAYIDGDHLPAGGAGVNSHGSHVCGTIGARPVAPGRFAGIAPGVTLISARVFPPDGGANQGDIANAIDEISRGKSADLINMSLGAPTGSQIARDAITDALERGTLCICAAGNSDGPVEFPAAFPEAAAISALGLLGWAPLETTPQLRIPQQPDRFGSENLYLANFSCFGPEITCAAPGVGIIATVLEQFGLTAPYGAMSGTSMASPVACAVLAARLSTMPAYGALPRDQTRAEMARSILQNACRDIGLETRFQGRGVPSVS